MSWIETVFGTGEELTVLQMTLRAIVVFLMALIMLRVTGQRTLGNRSVFDHVVMIMLGALLSRGITGASPFLPVVAGSLAIVLFHRFLGWLALYNATISRWIKGTHVSLYEHGKPKHDNMRKTLVSREDVMEGVRLKTNRESLEHVKSVYMESSGEMSVIQKDEMA